MTLFFRANVRDRAAATRPGGPGAAAKASLGGWIRILLLLLAFCVPAAHAAFDSFTASASPTSIAAGATTVISLNASNRSGQVDNVVLRLTLPAGWSCVSITVTGGQNPAPACSTPTINWSAGKVAGNTLAQMNVTVRAPSGGAGGTSTFNAALLSGSTQLFTASTQVAVTTVTSAVTAITCATACVQTAITSTVSWNVTFDRSVTGVDASVFTLVATGLTGSSITSVTGSGTSWVVTANVGTGAGTLGLNQTGAGTVSPTLTGTFTGQVYTTPATVVTAITCATACVQTAITATVQWNVTFNRSVSGVTAAAFSLVPTGLTGSAITAVTGSGTSWVVTANVGTGAGTLGLNQTGAGTVSPTLTGTFTGEVYTTPATVVTAITCATACVQTTITSSVQWNVTFNRSVTGVDASVFTLVPTGLTGSAITAVTGSGTSWVVTANVGTGAGTLGLNQTGAGTVSPTLTGTFTGEVYTTPATVVTAITCATACVQTTITSSVQWNVTFNRSVSGVDASIFTLVPTGLTGSAITAVTGSGTSWVVTADVGTGAGTLGLNQTGAGTVSPTLTGTFTGQVYTTPATVVTAITCATACVQTTVTPTVSWNITFNRSVSGVDATAFALVETGLSGSTITTVTGSGTSWVVTASVGTGAGSIGLNQTGAGTVSPPLTGTFTGEVYTTTATVVTAITCATACTLTTVTSTVQWNVTFNRSVTGVDASIFTLVPTGLTGSAITAVTGSGTSWVVTASLGSGTGTLGLDQTGPGTVSPVLTGTFTGEVYTSPTLVTAITCATACVQTTITATVQWNVTFNRSVTGVDASIFTLVPTGLTGSAITSVTGSGTNWVVTASVGTGAGTLGLDQTGPGSVSPVLTGTFTGEVYTTPPTVVTAISCATACVQTTITTTVQWNVTFNRSVSGVDASIFTLVPTGLTGSAITAVTGSGTSWVVTADVGTGAGTLGLNQTGAGTVSPPLTGTFTGEVYVTPDTIVTAISCASSCTQAITGSTVSWTVSFNRSVTGVGTSAFTLASTGLTGAFIAGVTGSGSTWTVTANLGVGSGTLRLDQTGPGSVSPVLTGTFTGETYTLLTAATLAIYRFDELGWTGTASEVADSSGNGYGGQALNGATTATLSPSPPITTNPGTCRYGIMSGGAVTNGYVATSLPELSTDFTVAGWIRSTNVASAGQVLFADDDASAGYAISLGDAGAGRLRFTSRGYTPADFDSGYTLSSDTWYFVAAVADIENKKRTLYVFDSSGNLLSAQTSVAATGTFTAGTAASPRIGHSNGSNYFKGYIDELQVYPRVLNEAAIASLVVQTHACPVISGPDHFQLSHGGTGVTCTATPVTLSAHNVDHTVLGGYAGTATLSSSAGRGDWTLVSGNGVLSNGAANDGAASYAFAAADNGVVTLGFQDTTAGTVSLGAVDGSVTETSGAATTGTDDPSLTFATAGFEFRADGVANAIGTQIAGKPSGTAPGAQALAIRAIRTSDSSTACEAALQGTQTVQMAYECVSPASCSAATLSVGATPVAGNPAGSVGSYTNATLTFDNAGLATLGFTWNDAGSARLHARYALPDASGAATGNFMAGSSNTFVARPFAFDLSVDANPGASSASGSAFTGAGTTFAATARAVVWSAGADADADGIADGMDASDASATNNADLSGNATTPNFAPSTALTLGSTLQLPADGTHPGLAGSPSAVFTNGVAAITGLRYDEVGIIEVTTAQGGSYLGLGTDETAKIRGSSGYVGRFHPARLAVAANVPLLASRCTVGAFSYIGQPVYFGTAPVLSVTAQSALGTTATNYTRSGFFKLDPALAGRSYTDASGTHPLSHVTAGSVTLAGSTAGSGTATLTLASGDTGDAVTFTRTTPEGPFTASVDAVFTAASLTDADGACHDPDANGSCEAFTISAIAGTQLRYGRLVAQSALGSEMQPLTVPVVAQYHDGSGFALNSADSCTALSTAVLDFGVGSAAGSPAAGVLSFPIGGGTSTASLPSTTLSGGRLDLRLSAPGAGNVGEIDYLIDLGTLGSSWLQYDWDGNGSLTDNPHGRASFGVYSGPSRVVFRRESW